MIGVFFIFIFYFLFFIFYFFSMFVQEEVKSATDVEKLGSGNRDGGIAFFLYFMLFLDICPEIGKNSEVIETLPNIGSFA
jgi:hypothetical protein